MARSPCTFGFSECSITYRRSSDARPRHETWWCRTSQSHLPPGWWSDRLLAADDQRVDRNQEDEATTRATFVVDGLATSTRQPTSVRWLPGVRKRQHQPKLVIKFGVGGSMVRTGVYGVGGSWIGCGRRRLMNGHSQDLALQTFAASVQPGNQHKWRGPCGGNAGTPVAVPTLDRRLTRERQGGGETPSGKQRSKAITVIWQTPSRQWRQQSGTQWHNSRPPSIKSPVALEPCHVAALDISWHGQSRHTAQRAVCCKHTRV